MSATATDAMTLDPAVVRALGMNNLENSLVHRGNVAAHVYNLAYRSSSDSLAGINLGWADMQASTDFLCGLVDDIDTMVTEALEDDPDADLEDVWSDRDHEICDSAVPIYTREAVMAAMDLQAEVDDAGLIGDDLSIGHIAQVALYSEAQTIGSALVRAIVEARAEIAEEIAEEEEEAEFAELEALYEKADTEALSPAEVARVAELEAKQGITEGKP